MADSLREALAEAMTDVEPIDSTPAPVESPEPTESVETTQQAADRARDETGRFAKTETGKIAKDPKNVQRGEMSPLVDPRVNPVAASEASGVQPPSSWKKEYWESFKTLSPEMQKYVHDRESQFASGVSTYKQEADRAKEIYTALAPYSEDLQKYNITFPQWIQQVGSVHQTLAKGTVEQKLETLSRLLPSYNVPARLAVQDAQGQWQLLDPSRLPQQQQQQAPQQQFKPEDIAAIVEQKLEQRTMSSEIEKFAESHPHYEAVKPQMAGLLQAGMAVNLQDAYDKSLRINPELWEAEQQRLTKEKAEQAAQERAARVNKARSNAVSTRSDTPSGSMSADGKKGLRANLDEAADSILGGGRV